MKIYSIFLGLVLFECAVCIQAEEQDPEIDNFNTPPPPSTVYLTLRLTGGFTHSRRYCFCFNFQCNVPGMRNGFKVWVVNYVSGYVVINGRLYRVYRCDYRPLTWKSMNSSHNHLV